MKVFIGYDQREAIAAEVCEYSIKRHWPEADVRFLKLTDPDVALVYDRPYTSDHGVKIDDGDGRPFSTDFAFSRFLVPYLSGYEGWSLFVDCDFLFLSSPEELIALQDPDRAVMCVHHRHRPTSNQKMDGQVQSAYERKNWSSLMMINCAHPENLRLTPEMVNTMPGSFLHRFAWLHTRRIGEIPETWNWLSGISPTTDGPDSFVPKAIHYTMGFPGMEGYENCAYANAWWGEKNRMDVKGKVLA